MNQIRYINLFKIYIYFFIRYTLDWYIYLAIISEEEKKFVCDKKDQFDTHITLCRKVQSLSIHSKQQVNACGYVYKCFKFFVYNNNQQCSYISRSMWKSLLWHPFIKKEKRKRKWMKIHFSIIFYYICIYIYNPYQIFFFVYFLYIVLCFYICLYIYKYAGSNLLLFFVSSGLYFYR